MLPVYQVAAGGGITEEELPGSIVHFHRAARSHHCSPVTLTFLLPRVELLRTVNCGEPCWGEALGTGGSPLALGMGMTYAQFWNVRTNPEVVPGKMGI